MAFGLIPIRQLGGGKVPTNVYKKEASVILGVGDPVVLTGTAESATGIPLITRAAAGSGTITGVVVAIYPNINDLSKRYMAAADTGYVIVADHPDTVFIIEEDSVGGNIAVTAVGEFCDLATVGNASTVNGLSTVQLDSSDAATGDNMRILGLHQGPKATPNTANNVWEVLINEHTYRAVQTPV